MPFGLARPLPSRVCSTPGVRSIGLHHVRQLKLFLEMADPTHIKIKVPLKLGGLLGFLGGFMFAYQRSSSECHCRESPEICEFLCAVRFWGWSENKREAEMDLQELRERAAQGLPLYGSSPQPDWVQQAANRNSQWSQLKFCTHILYSMRAFLHSSAFSTISCLSNVSLSSGYAICH